MSLTVKVAMAGGGGGAAMPGAGDPGLFGFLGGAINKVASVARHIPGPIGVGASAVHRATQTSSPRVPRSVETQIRGIMEQHKLPTSGLRGALGSVVGGGQVPVPGARGALQRFLPGGETGYMPATDMRGYHLNKTDYFLKDGTFVPAGSKWVKNRRRNPLNPRAASKAIARLESAKKAVGRINRITIRKPKCCK